MTHTQHSKFYGPLMMLAASLCFAGGGAALKVIPWNPLAINGLRNLIASIVIGIYLLVIRHRLRFNRTVFAGAICMFGVTTTFTIANKLTTAGNAIILQYTTPVWIILLMFIFFRKKPRGQEILAIIAILIGILCFFLDSISAGGMAGNCTAIISGAFYAGVFMLNQFEKGDALSSMFLGQLSCGILLSPLIMRETEFSVPIWLAILFLGVVQIGFAYIFFSKGILYTPPVTACIINSVEPILNPVLVAFFWGEILGPLSILGGAIVILSVLIYNLLQGKAESN